MEKPYAVGITCTFDQTKVTIDFDKNQLDGNQAIVFVMDYLVKHEIVFENMIWSNDLSLSFLIHKNATLTLIKYLKEWQQDVTKTVRPKNFTTDDQVGTIVVVGFSLKQDRHLLSSVFQNLTQKNIPLLFFQTLETQLRFTVSNENIPLAMNLLHNQFIC